MGREADDQLDGKDDGLANNGAAGAVNGKAGGADDSSKAGSTDAATEALARRRGWLPKEEFTGDESKWVDANTFVERGDNFTKNLKSELKQVRAELAAFKGTAEAFKAFHKEAMEGKQRELDAALKQLKTQHREAIRDGDDNAADALEGRMDVLNTERAKIKKELENPPAAPSAQAAAGKTPELAAWIEEGDNHWFETDIPMQKYALALAEELVKNGETLRGRAFLDKVAEQVRADFPHKFKNPNRARAGAAESGSGAVKTKPGRTAADLPEEDRALMKQFIKEGWTTEEKFLKDYRWDN